MKGIHAKNQRLAWEGDNLYAKPSNITLRGGAKWLDATMNDEELSNWVEKGIGGEDPWNHMQRIRLRQMCCPTCKAKTEVKQLKLTRGAQFWNITCQECKEVTNTKRWACNCDVLWYKCGLHEKGFQDTST